MSSLANGLVKLMESTIFPGIATLQFHISKSRKGPYRSKNSCYRQTREYYCVNEVEE